MAAVPLVLAHRYSGANRGAQIQAANDDLGGAPGIIVSQPDGSHANMSRVALSTDRHLVLGFGTYEPDSTSTDRGLFVYNHRCSIVGNGWGTVIKERNKTGQDAKNVFIDYGQIYGPESAKGDNNGVDDVRISDLQILGNSPDFDSAVPALHIGNCHRVHVERVYMNATCSIGIAVGGTSGAGYHSTDVWLKDCLLDQVASQPIGVVNGRRFHVINNTSMNAGQVDGPGASGHIDLEPNAPTDWLDSFEVTGNVIYGPPNGNAGNGIIVQIGGATPGTVGYGIISNNTVFGSISGPFGTATDNLSNGVQLNGATGVNVTNNKLYNCKQKGVDLNSCTRCMVANNHLEQCGGGGVPSMQLDSCTQCTVRGNDLVFYEGSDAGSCGNWIAETGSSDKNRFFGNEISGFFTATVGGVLLVGADSHEYDNTFNGVKARTFKRDGTIEDNTLVKRSGTIARAAKQFTTADVAADVLGVCIGTFSPNGSDYYSIVVVDETVPVKVKSDGAGTIAIGASVEPSGATDGYVKTAVGTRIGINDNAAVAASAGDLCTICLRLP